MFRIGLDTEAPRPMKGEGSVSEMRLPSADREVSLRPRLGMRDSATVESEGLGKKG